jgi:hypothetical protein
MIYKLQVSGLVLATALLTAAGSQRPNPAAAGNLELQLKPERLEQGVPQAFTFLIVNKTDHDVRIPVPTIQCEDSFDGDILLRVRFTPLKPEPADGLPGCAHDNELWPPIMDRIQDWKTLHSGDTLTLNADREHLFYEAGNPGKYEFWALYSPPSIDPSDQKRLEESRIDFPRGKLRTAPVTFVRLP